MTSTAVTPTPPISLIRYWSTAIACLFCLCFGMGLMSIFGFFVNPLAEEFGVGRATITAAPIMLLIVPAFTGPIVGRLADTVPIKMIMLSGVALSMMGLALVSIASTLSFAAWGFLFFAIGLSMFGPIVVNALLTKVYQLKAGRALAIAAMGSSLSAATFPIWVAMLLESGWRDALQTLALTVFIIVSVIVSFVLPSINSPKNGSDLLSDNETKDEDLANSADVANESQKAEGVEVDDDVQSKFWRNSNFWFIGFGVAISLSAALVLGICYPPHLENIGFSINEIASIMALGGASGLVGKLLIASFIDRYRTKVKWFAASVLLIKVMGLAALLNSGPFYTVLVAASLIGFGGGAFIPMHPILNSCYFDRSIIGRVNGAQMPLFLPFGVIGAPLAGYAYDQLGSYDIVLKVLIVAMLTGAALLLRLKAVEPVAQN